ncbi:MAG: HAMP domain-containing sensor histidine kinase [Myxococcales bacterium]|nr:HAMP domain-containing sensor histidine kinase [Myxococcales bacterium]
MSPHDELLASALAVVGGARAALLLTDERGAQLVATVGFTTPPALDTMPELFSAQAGLVSTPGFIGAPLLSTDGRPLGALGVWHAVTTPSSEPFAAVARLGAALLTTQRETAALRLKLERADRLAMVGQLAAGLAHELGTPLTVVAGRARQLLAGSIPPEQAADAARTIVEQSERMTGIIRQVLDYARRRGPRPGRYDVRTLMRQCVGLLEPVAAKKAITLSFVDPGEPRLLDFDGSQLMQVMMNLVANAIAATPPSGRVELSTRLERDVTPPPNTGLSRRDFTALEVRDTGAGVSAEHLDRLFEPFFTTKETGEGTGLGLSVAQSIVRDHEGWIGVDSTRGAGTVFIVYLPS